MPSALRDFHHQLSGPENGPRWVFLHGLMGFRNNWGKIIAGLDRTERCLAYDQRGHGRSMKPDSGYAPEDYANDLHDILNELRWDKVTLVGHSMGGRNALNFCVRFPERVERFVLEDIGPEGRPGNLEYYQELLGLVPTPFPNRAAARAFFSGEFLERARTRDNPKMLAEYFYANMEEKPDNTVSWRFSPQAVLESVREGQDRDRWDEWKALRVPTLLIRGEKSRELSAETYEKMLSLQPMIHGVVIPQAGHWVHADQPEAFLHALRGFAGLS
ncbi:MAG: alpha/beta hydrolase [Bdellovibrionaceae bacterium]|nr:alpha/beta hydrolase [Pseudobdellovibrionaceae bacterium]MBX3033020.1 alpha/beta hydrolase [Pseudobdellovibrionaceae bacterium]